MSGGIAQLVAVGAQDVHLVGQPEVSFFRSTYKRHTNFSQTTERQVIQGNVSNGGMSTVRFERKGDLLGYVYLVANDGSTTQEFSNVQWRTMISKVELLVGGQVVDEQDSTYSTLIAPTLSATSTAKSVGGNLFGGASGSRFYPLRFAFCENWQSALPLISLQYHDVELRITWGSAAADASKKWDVYANYAYLDTQEREVFASQPQNMIMTKRRLPQVPKSRSSTLTTPSSTWRRRMPLRSLWSTQPGTSSSSKSTVRMLRITSLRTPTLPAFHSTTTRPTGAPPRGRSCSFTHSAWMPPSSSPRGLSTSPALIPRVSLTIPRTRIRMCTP
jgi:hypothetical protein